MGYILQEELKSTNNYKLCLTTKSIINTEVDITTIIVDALKVISILEKWQFDYHMLDDYCFQIIN